MDPMAGEQQEAPAPSNRGASPTTSEPEVRRHAPLSELVVAGGSGPAEGSGSGGGVEDEQVERFYALLANIRALRDIYGGGGGSWRKRARGSTEPQWRPAFTMEDFQCARKERRDGGAGRQHPEIASDDEDGSEVVEEEKVRVSARAPTRQSTKLVVESKECVGTSDVSSP